MIIETIPEPDYRNMSLYERYIMELEKTVENKDKTIENLKNQLKLKNNSG